MLRSSLRRLSLRLAAGGASGGRWVLYDALTGEEAPQDDAAAALLLGGPSAADATADSAAAGAAASPSAAGGDAGSSPPQGPQQADEQQQRRRVWVGIVGAPPAPAGGDLLPDLDAAGRQQQQAHVTRSPSKFVRLASGASPAAQRSPGPRKVLVS